MPTERLQKILARGGYASRRAAEKLITEGHVRVNGRVVTELGTKADPRNDRVEVNGERVVAEQLVYVVLHKPRGVVTTMSDPEGRPSIKEILDPIGARVYPVGRLDFSTSGVLLATNDGAFADGLMHPKKAVPKTYVLKVRNKMESKDLDRWREGVRLEDGMTLPAKASLLRHEGDKTWVELTIREGRNQQIRRMGDATGFPVMRLARVTFAGVSSEGLRPGEWRHLTRDELAQLKKDYGVPKRLIDVDAREVKDGLKGRSQKHSTRGPKVTVGGNAAKPRDTHARGRDSRMDDASSSTRGPARGTRGAARDSRGDARGQGRSDSRGPSRAGARGASRHAPPTPQGDSSGPRYGGGSPGRRGYGVREDWGGGADRRTPRTEGASDSREGREGGRGESPRRGSSGGPRGSSEDRPRGDVGGRGGQSRTTGTGGGIGASGGSYRGRSRSR